MVYLSTITSKRQITIPSALYKKFDFRDNQKITIKVKNGKIEIEPTWMAVEKLAGSISVSKKLQSLDIGEAIEKAKKIHFKNKYKLSK